MPCWPWRTSYVTTTHPVLRELASHALAHLRTDLARKHVPDKRGYLIIGPAPETPVGLAGAVAGLRDDSRHAPAPPRA